MFLLRSFYIFQASHLKDLIRGGNRLKKKEKIIEKYDDFALKRVPQSERKHWFGMATMRFGQVSSMLQLLLGATLGFGMDFWSAFWAITLGAVIIEVLSIFVGIAGMREGLNTTLLVRWAGFGKLGSILLSLVITISLVGWFGIQNEVFANGLQQILGGQVWAWSIVTGLLVTLIVVFGIKSLGITAYITVPLFLLVVFYSIGSILSDFSLGTLVNMSAPGEPISLAMGASMVAGAFIAGGIIVPDLSRYNKSSADVVKQTLVGITLGEYLIGLSGVLLAHALQSADVIGIVMSTSGIIGVLILITATIKINDVNLYSSSLGLVNLIDLGFGKRANLPVVTFVLGVFGTILSVLGILGHFQSFLLLLGVALPPVGGILIAEYFFIKRYKKALDESREKGLLPDSYESWNPITLFAWVVGSLAGHFLQWGIPSVTSLIVGGVLYWTISKVVNRREVVTFGHVATYQSGEKTSEKVVMDAFLEKSLS